MCGCERHQNPDADCTCICPEHGNFQAAYDLAMQRYDVIRDLQAEAERLRTERCTCPWVDPKYWMTHYGAVEPGSTQEYDPTCPLHGELRDRAERSEATLAKVRALAEPNGAWKGDKHVRLKRRDPALGCEITESYIKVSDLLAVLDQEADQ